MGIIGGKATGMIGRNDKVTKAAGAFGGKVHASFLPKYNPANRFSVALMKKVVRVTRVVLRSCRVALAFRCQ